MPQKYGRVQWRGSENQAGRSYVNYEAPCDEGGVEVAIWGIETWQEETTIWDVVWRALTVQKMFDKDLGCTQGLARRRRPCKARYVIIVRSQANGSIGGLRARDFFVACSYKGIPNLESFGYGLDLAKDQ